MKLVLLLFTLLAGCTCDVPEEDYTCVGYFVCYGDHFGLTSVTGQDAEEVEAEFLSRAYAQMQEAKCVDYQELYVSCKEVARGD